MPGPVLAAIFGPLASVDRALSDSEESSSASDGTFTSDSEEAASPPESRRPADLDAEEQAQLERALAASSASAAGGGHGSNALPLVSAPRPLSELAAEYALGARADLYRAKALHLERQYTAIRRVRGDGNCFYRGFHVSWMERLLQLPAYAQEEVCARLVPAASVRYADALPEGMLRADLIALGTGFAERTRAMCESARADSRTAEVELLRAASDPAAMEASLRWLRLLTSAYMRANRETFEPVCADGSRTFDAFLHAEVETMGVEADEMQVEAITRALQLRVRVEYLDATPAPWSDRCGVHRFLVCGPLERTGPAAAAEARAAGAVASDSGGVSAPPQLTMPGTPLVACLLFRPGHYDILAPREWDNLSLAGVVGVGGTASGTVRSQGVFVPPLPPQTPSTPCLGCDGPRHGCVLCAKPLCIANNCPTRATLLAARATWATRTPPPTQQQAQQPMANPLQLSARSNSALATASPTLYHLPPSFGDELAAAPQPVCDECITKLPIFNSGADVWDSGCLDPTIRLYRCQRATGPGGCGFLGFRPECRAHPETCAAEAVHCPFGCSARPWRSELEAHLSVCPDAEMSCPHCQVAVRRADIAAHVSRCKVLCGACSQHVPSARLAQHQRETCPARMIVCALGCGEMHAARDAHAHAQLCPSAIVTCLWSCGEPVARGSMRDHQVTCPNAWLRCPAPGCNQKLRRRQAREHWARCQQLPDVCPDCAQLVLKGEMATHQERDCVARRTTTFTCPICHETEDIDGAFQADCVELDGTDHLYCFECMVAHVRHKINNMNDASDERVQCMKCTMEITPFQVEGLRRPRTNKEDEVYQLEAHFAEKYAQILMFQELRTHPGFRSCPRNCGYGVDFGGQPATFLRCNKCKDDAGHSIIFCLAEGCGEPHDPREISCAEYRRRQQEQRDGSEKGMRALEEAGVIKHCQQCAVRIVKAGECQHMDCPLCQSQFCWHCLAPHTPTVEFDVSYHRRECLLWQPPGTGGQASSAPPRPASDCSRTANGDNDSSVERFEGNTHCACTHDCPCTAELQLVSRCKCTSVSACTCGLSVVRCSSCHVDRCRLCNRVPHPGEACLEDQERPGESDQMRGLLPTAASA